MLSCLHIGFYTWLWYVLLEIVVEWRRQLLLHFLISGVALGPGRVSQDLCFLKPLASGPWQSHWRAQRVPVLPVLDGLKCIIILYHESKVDKQAQATDVTQNFN